MQRDSLVIAQHDKLVFSFARPEGPFKAVSLGATKLVWTEGFEPPTS